MLPVYILVETSSAMKGEPFGATHTVLENIASALNDGLHNDISLCIIEFNSTATVLRPLSRWENSSQMPEIVQSEENVNADYGLEKLCECYEQNKKENADSPILILITSGSQPSIVQQDKLKNCGFSKTQILCDGSRLIDDFYRSITFDIGNFGQTDIEFFHNLLQVWSAPKDIYDVYKQGWGKQLDKAGINNLKDAAEITKERAEKITKEIDQGIADEQQKCADLIRKAEQERDDHITEAKLDADKRIKQAEQERDAAKKVSVDAMQTVANAVGKQHRAEWQRMVAYIAAACVVFLAIGLSSYFGIIAAAAKLTVAKCDERIAAAQAEADKKVKDAGTNVADSIAKIEADANKKIADAKTASEEAIQSANENADKKIVEHKQKLNEEYAQKVTAVRKLEDDVNTKIDKADKLEKSLKQKLEKLDELAKQSEEQVHQNTKKEKELAAALTRQQEATAAAEQSKKEYADRLKTADVDIAELNNFKENFDTIRNGYWHWAGNNQQIPILGAAKIIGRDGGTLVLEDNGNGSTREKHRFNVLIEQLTKEQKALVPRFVQNYDNGQVTSRRKAVCQSKLIHKIK